MTLRIVFLLLLIVYSSAACNSSPDVAGSTEQGSTSAHYNTDSSLPTEKDLAAISKEEEEYKEKEEYMNDSIYYGEEDEIKDCSALYSASDDAYSYSRKAYNEGNWDDMKYYLKKAMGSFSDAMSYADDCGCEDAYYAADDGYAYAKKGYSSEDYDETKNYARRAKNEADDTMNYANNCSE